MINPKKKQHNCTKKDSRCKWSNTLKSFKLDKLSDTNTPSFGKILERNIFNKRKRATMKENCWQAYLTLIDDLPQHWMQ